MSPATLLLREKASASLATLVEKSQQRKPPLPEYDLQLSVNQLDLVLHSKPEATNSFDEGFESDIDSLSIVSSDGSFGPETKTTETDSANGSTSSDSDTENPEVQRSYPKESYNLVECVCYTDLKFPDILVFVIKEETLVFKFDNLNRLRDFYLNFTALKAVTNQKTHSSVKFNLLQRTDQNGVTHIEITREPVVPQLVSHCNSPHIISLNTPEGDERNRTVGKKKDVNLRQRTDSTFVNYKTLSTSSEHIPDEPPRPSGDITLRKVWNSAEDLLDNCPKRPERRKKPKGKAPPPPAPSQGHTISDVLRGEYVRVKVITDLVTDRDFIAKSQLKDKKSRRPSLVTLLTSKPKSEPSWTNSVPRCLKKQRSKSETRGFTPMTYRYIDITSNYQPMSNRLFGLSPKLRDFAEPKSDTRWHSTQELSRGNLKSVIKKDENKKKNDKKVTFSAYTTVQVV